MLPARIDRISAEDEPSREKLERWALICANAGQHDEAERLRSEAAKADTQDDKEQAA